MSLSLTGNRYAIPGSLVSIEVIEDMNRMTRRVRAQGRSGIFVETEFDQFTDPISQQEIIADLAQEVEKQEAKLTELNSKWDEVTIKVPMSADDFNQQYMTITGDTMDIRREKEQEAFEKFKREQERAMKMAEMYRLAAQDEETRAHKQAKRLEKEQAELEAIALEVVREENPSWGVF